MANTGKLKHLGKVMETEILVIGGGAAGLWTANRARELGAHVLIVDNGPPDWGGLASMAGGDLDAVLPEENIDDWLEELVYYEDGLCAQDMVEEILKHSYDRLKDYERLGCEFFRGSDGKLKGVPQRGLKHVKLYPSKRKGQGGLDMVRGLVKEANHFGVKRLDRTHITDLLLCNGVAAGAVGFNAINGEFYIFKAKAVVLSTGWNAGGMSMAYKAGAELRDCEFIHVHNVPKLFKWEGQTTLMPLGAKFVNAKGEPFMDTYSPVLGCNTETNYNVIGFALEYRKNRGPIYLDISHIKSDDLELVKPQESWQLLNYKKLLDLGIDLFKGNTEWMPMSYGPVTGVVVDMKGRTKVPGLFASGTIWATENGVYKGGWHLCRCAVTGHIVGEAVADYVKPIQSNQIDEAEIKRLKSDLYAPFSKKGIPPQEVLKEINKEVVSPADVSIMKTEKGLKRALDQIEGIGDEILPQMSASRDAHQLMKIIEARGFALRIELFLKASLMREESRAGHYREDYPNRDDENWLKWIIAYQEDGKINFRTDPVPFERYKFKPNKYYIDNFKFHEAF